MNGTSNRIDLVRPDSPELAFAGTHSIGVRMLNFTRPSLTFSTDDNTPFSQDRALPVELWYPSDHGSDKLGIYHTILRDGTTPVTLFGRAQRDADFKQGPFPLVLLSHGFPGNRFLLSHFAENLATKGYIVASVDHADSTYPEEISFESTRLNRPLDQKFVVDQLTGPDSPIAGIVDDQQVGVVGYSMGGYGALIYAGAGLTEAGIAHDDRAVSAALAVHKVGSETHQNLIDPRVKAVVLFGPWGRNYEGWNASGLANVTKPVFIVAGSEDHVSGYENGMCLIYDELRQSDRFLLTFERAGHNAGAPFPAPIECWSAEDAAFNHYSDPVWDTLRMNNISQHFLTAFLGKHLKSDPGMAGYLPGAQPTPVSDLKGFDDRPALGLRLDHAAP